MNRLLFVKVHLFLSGLSLVFLCLMAISGSLHLLVGDEFEEVSIVGSYPVGDPQTKEEFVPTLNEILREIDPNYSYDYVKGTASSMLTRPMSRTYYSIKIDSGSAAIKKHVPGLRKKLMEFHQGHGAKATRTIMGILGIIAIFAAITGLWLGLSNSDLRKTTISTVLVGALVYLILITM